MAERWPEKLYALRGGPVPGYLEAALIVNHDGCHRNGIEIAEYVPVSKLTEEEIRCEYFIRIGAEWERMAEAAESRCKGLEETAKAVVDAHRAVIEGVTPGHPNWCGGKDHEEYEARFSRWHAATRALRDELAALQHSVEDEGAE